MRQSRVKAVVGDPPLSRVRHLVDEDGRFARVRHRPRHRRSDEVVQARRCGSASPVERAPGIVHRWCRRIGRPRGRVRDVAHGDRAREGGRCCANAVCGFGRPNFFVSCNGITAARRARVGRRRLQDKEVLKLVLSTPKSSEPPRAPPPTHARCRVFPSACTSPTSGPTAQASVSTNFPCRHARARLSGS